MTYNWPDGRPLVGPFNVPTLPDDAYRVEPMQVNTDPRLPGYTEAPTLPVGDTVEARSAGVASFDSAGSIAAPSSRPNPGSPAPAPERLENTMTDLPTQVGGGYNARNVAMTPPATGLQPGEGDAPITNKP